MDWLDRHVVIRRTLIMSAAIFAQAPAVSSSAAQGCEPIRFTTPVNLGGQGEVYQRAGQWQLTVAYRRLVSNEWFVGTKESPALAPGGESPVIRIHTLVADVAYAFQSRYRLRLSVPVSTGSFTRIWADGAKHQQTGKGIGDVSVMGEAWMLEPRTHPYGNVALSIGVKAPTGSHTVASQFYTATGAVDYPADQTIQPGDGGWGLLLQGQAFREIVSRVHAYAFGSYMANPKSRIDVQQSPGSGPFWSVPDVYSARLGGTFLAWPDQGVTMSLGGRVDGIPVHDWLGRGDDATLKRSSLVVFADPGFSITTGPGTLTASVPYRLHVNRQKSVLEQSTNGINGGGFAKYLIFLSYTYRL